MAETLDVEKVDQLVTASVETARKVQANLSSSFDELVGKLESVRKFAADGDVKKVRDLVKECCDLEFELMLDCESSGDLSEYVNPDPDEC